MTRAIRVGSGGSGLLRVLSAGPYGVMLEFGGAADARRGFGLIEETRRASRADASTGWENAHIVDVIPAERTVLVIASFDAAGQQALRNLQHWLDLVDWTSVGDDAHTHSPEVELKVRYDGPDLADVAALTETSVDEIVRLHRDTVFTVAFTGFAPGFAYLAGLPRELTVPRRSAPRTRVESGAVGLAGPYSGVYPRSSPGGWQIIGHLADENAALWDPHRDPPALLQPGTRVRFRASDVETVGTAADAESSGRLATDDAGAHAGAVPLRGTELRVVRPGLLTTVQDLGRPGYAHLGVPRSGAADQAALRLANRLVGNPEGAAALETTLTGCTVTLTRARWIAVTGARATVLIDGRPSGQGAATYAPAGSVIDIGTAEAGVRSYLAIAGGIDTEPVLGSRSADILSGLGHEHPITKGDLLPVGEPHALPPDIPGLGLAPQRNPTDPATLRLLPGPRDDWFTADALATLTGTRYEVSAASNRTALRLSGPPLHRTQDGELPSEGLVPGAVQVPPDGRPVLFLADHPVTGGYPVIGCVHPADLPAAAQARPGSGIRFRLMARG